MKNNAQRICIAALAAACAAAACRGESLEELLSADILPAGSAYSTWDAVYREVDRLDAEADRKWRSVEGRAAYDAHRKDLHAKMLEALGEFPERTPLNAKVLGTVRKDGYRVEKVLFESMPGLFVTANLFLPDGGRLLF